MSDITREGEGVELEALVWAWGTAVDRNGLCHLETLKLRDQLQAALERAEAQRDKARAWLTEYADHRAGCIWLYDKSPCTCGYHAALAATEAQAGGVTAELLPSCEHCGTALQVPRFCSDITFCRARRREADTPLPEGVR